MLITTTIGAGQTVRFSEQGDFFRVLSADAQINIDFFAQGREIADSYGIAGGYAEEFTQPNDAFEITAPAGATVQFVSRFGSRVQYDVGQMTVTGNPQVQVSNFPAVQGAVTQAAPVVTNASGQLIAANAARKYLLIQNKDATGVVYLNLAGAAATVAGGVRILPGASLEVQGYQSSAAIFAIGDIANNANVVTVEG